jgi:hypothetical protein
VILVDDRVAAMLDCLFDGDDPAQRGGTRLRQGERGLSSLMRRPSPNRRRTTRKPRLRGSLRYEVSTRSYPRRSVNATDQWPSCEGPRGLSRPLTYVHELCVSRCLPTGLLAPGACDWSRRNDREETSTLTHHAQLMASSDSLPRSQESQQRQALPSFHARATPPIGETAGLAGNLGLNLPTNSLLASRGLLSRDSARSSARIVRAAEGCHVYFRSGEHRRRMGGP